MSASFLWLLNGFIGLYLLCTLEIMLSLESACHTESKNISIMSRRSCTWVHFSTQTGTAKTLKNSPDSFKRELTLYTYSFIHEWIHFSVHLAIMLITHIEFVVPVCTETPPPVSLLPMRWRWSLRNVDASWWWGGVCSWWLLLSSAQSRGGCWLSTNDSLGQRGGG